MSYITERILEKEKTVEHLFLSWREQYVFKLNHNLVQFLPTLDMERRESLKCSFTCEKLEATLCVLDPSHTKEPHQEVKAIHEKCTKDRSLWQRHNSGYLKTNTVSNSLVSKQRTN